MQVGIDSFAAANPKSSGAVAPADRLRELVEEIEQATESDSMSLASASTIGRNTSIRRRR